ncbi:carboxymuconolactone decarboxylase family protein [Aureibacillus halotolerans]|uniref:AhpD family alkylhydroperoxidase n=1 Tax=Aureibacillus halotolerans TaxID=1508390 RepID=A0A4V3D5P3_9BACI|nr:carboxymuconolactone decarboxylase family protein [Aureibacillus halotolerans]TDQ40787.1 AhpD family alkylhydroperoxidase [Aureibacillus halotolerans]
MEQRLSIETVFPEGVRAMMALETAVATSGLEKSLLELVKIRASQLNGCAFCLDMHTKDARKAGESEQRIYTLPAWRETPYFTQEERAALELTEAVTLISENHVPDAVYSRATESFDETQIAKLILAIVTINAWNRLAIAALKMPV